MATIQASEPKPAALIPWAYIYFVCVMVVRLKHESTLATVDIDVSIAASAPWSKHMPNITLSEITYAKLQAIARPFVDTEDSVVSRIADFYVQQNARSSNGNGQTVSAKHDSVRLNPESGKLTHTKLISATVDGSEMHRPNWNSLMFHMHALARKRLGSFDALRKASGANLRHGRYEDNGYHFVPEADVSIQGVDANLACEHSFRLAKVMKVPLKVTFEWREKDEAAYPGQSGVIEWTSDEAS